MNKKRINKAKINLDTIILEKGMHDQTLMNIYLVNGVKLQGYIKAYDDDTILLGSAGKTNTELCQLIYKHSIATIFVVQ